MVSDRMALLRFSTSGAIGTALKMQPPEPAPLLWMSVNPRLLLQSTGSNFDFPPASSATHGSISTPPVPPSRRSTINTSARIRHLRNLLQSQDQSDPDSPARIAMDQLDREMLEMSHEPISGRMRRRMDDLEARFETEETSGATSSLTRSRRRVTGPSARLQRLRDRFNQQAGDNLQDVLGNGHIPEVPLPPPRRFLSPSMDREYAQEAQFVRDDRWRARKRRKLDDFDPPDSLKGFKYGHKGTTVPGALRMEVAGCDGGMYSEAGSSSSPWNVLHDDLAVYCTKSDRCNIILRHIGGMPFDLRKLVIKTPRSGYDACAQTGMIFVSMDDDGLLERTAQYQIKYSPPRKPRRRGEHSQLRLAPSHHYYTSTRSPLRSIDESRFLESPYTSNPRQLHDVEPVLDRAHSSGHDYPERVPDFEVSTYFEDFSDEEVPILDSFSAGGTRSAEAIADRLSSLQDQYIPSTLGPRVSPTPTNNDDVEDESSNSNSGDCDSTDSSSSDEESMANLMRANYENGDSAETTIHRAVARTRRLEEREQRVRRRSTPNTIEIVHVQDPPTFAAGRDASDKEKTKVLLPHARFFITKDKSVVSIKFDPPV